MRSPPARLLVLPPELQPLWSSPPACGKGKLCRGRTRHLCTQGALGPELPAIPRVPGDMPDAGHARMVLTSCFSPHLPEPHSRPLASSVFLLNGLQLLLSLPTPIPPRTASVIRDVLPLPSHPTPSPAVQVLFVTHCFLRVSLSIGSSLSRGPCCSKV